MSLIVDIKTYIVSENKFVINALQSDHQSYDISRGKWGAGGLAKRETHTMIIWKGERGAQGFPERLWPHVSPGSARIYVNI